jgi:hypothetical protein
MHNSSKSRPYTAQVSVLKLLLLFAHLLGTSLALGAIVATDIRLLRRLADDRVRIAPPNPFVMRLITLALVVLCVTGASMLALGLHDDPTYLSGNPKLQAKLVLVALLIINAVVLHRYTFPGLARGRRVARWKLSDFIRVALPVSISNCLWMYCAFLGIASPWSHTVSMEFVFGNAAWLLAATLAGVTTILVIAAQDRTNAQRGWIDVLKRRLDAVANALRI